MIDGIFITYVFVLLAALFLSSGKPWMRYWNKKSIGFGIGLLLWSVGCFMVAYGVRLSQRP